MRRAARPTLYLSTLLIVLGLGKAHAAWVGGYDFTGSSRFGWSLVYVALLCVAAYAAGLPDEPADAYAALWDGLRAAAAAAVAISVLQLVRGNAVLPRFVIGWSAVFAVPFWTLTCFLAVRGRRRERARDRVVAVIDDHEEVGALLEDVGGAPERPVTVTAVVAPADLTPSIGDRAPLVELVQRERATVLVLDRRAQADAGVVAQAAEVHQQGVRVRTLSLFYEQWLGKLPLSELERMSLLFDIREVHQSTYVRVKRLVDVVSAAFGAVVLAAVVPFVMVGNLAGNRGPLIYRQDRVGKRGRRFVILKFRTMRSVDGDAPNEWTDERDPRITPFGRFLRRTHLDELPQVLNILTGDLSIIGPRPEQPHYVAQLEAKIPFYAVRHLVRPGLTGWAQVKYGYAGNERDALQKLQYEFFYLRHQGLAFDLRIVARTLRTVAGLSGR